MSNSTRQSLKAALLTLFLVLSSAACTMKPPKPEIPQPKEIRPAECQKEVIENRFASVLSKLSANFLDLSPAQQARELLSLKAEDSARYAELRALALRCAV